MENYLAVAYWAGRKEEAGACALRASRFLFALSEISDDMTGWRETGRSKKDALANKVYEPHALDDLERLFAKGISRREVNHVLWNGKDDSHGLSLNMRCGVYSTVPTLGNAVVLNLSVSFDVASTSGLRKLAMAFVEAWEPDWMAITSQTKMNEAPKNEYGNKKPFLDKALYVKSTMERPSVPADITEEKLNQGMLFLNAS